MFSELIPTLLSNPALPRKFCGGGRSEVQIVFFFHYEKNDLENILQDQQDRITQCLMINMCVLQACFFLK